MMTTENQTAAPPSIAVGFLCQRSVLGTAMKPKRRASARTKGVSINARTNDAATARNVRGLKGIGVSKLCHKKAPKAQNDSPAPLCTFCASLWLISGGAAASELIINHSFQNPVEPHLRSKTN